MMMVASPAFRNAVLFLFLAGAVGIALLVNGTKTESTTREQAVQAQANYAATAIKETDLRLENVQLKAAGYGLSDYILSGNITNDSSAALGSVTFDVTITDCQNTDCRIVGQARQSAYATVPSKQMRAFSSYAIRFDNLPPVGQAKRSWAYKIASIRAE
jgi:hypothetical protein